jgi:hypothetical protein
MRSVIERTIQINNILCNLLSNLQDNFRLHSLISLFCKLIKSTRYCAILTPHKYFTQNILTCIPAFIIIILILQRRLGCLLFRIIYLFLNWSRACPPLSLIIHWFFWPSSMSHAFTHHSLMELSPFEKRPIVRLLKNFPAFYGTRRFITMFTRALHRSLSLANSI